MLSVAPEVGCILDTMALANAQLEPRPRPSRQPSFSRGRSSPNQCRACEKRSGWWLCPADLQKGSAFPRAAEPPSSFFSLSWGRAAGTAEPFRRSARQSRQGVVLRASHVIGLQLQFAMAYSLAVWLLAIAVLGVCPATTGWAEEESATLGELLKQGADFARAENWKAVSYTHLTLPTN